MDCFQNTRAFQILSQFEKSLKTHFHHDPPLYLAAICAGISCD